MCLLSIVLHKKLVKKLIANSLIFLNTKPVCYNLISLIKNPNKLTTTLFIAHRLLNIPYLPSKLHPPTFLQQNPKKNNRDDGARLQYRRSTDRRLKREDSELKRVS